MSIEATLTEIKAILTPARLAVISCKEADQGGLLEYITAAKELSIILQATISSLETLKATKQDPRDQQLCEKAIQDLRVLIAKRPIQLL